MSTPIVVREATAEDRAALWEWYNDPRRYSFLKTKPKVTRADHWKWFDARMAAADTLLVVGLVDIIRIGMVRFEREAGDRFSASLLLRPPYFGKGLAAGFLHEACKLLQTREHAAKVVAKLRRSTPASASLFEQSGGRVQPLDDAYFEVSFGE